MVCLPSNFSSSFLRYVGCMSIIYTVLKPVISFDTFLSYEPVQDLSTRVAVDCHCDATRLTFMFQILKVIVDTAMVSATLVSKIQQTVTLVTRNCNFDNQQIAC